MLIDTVNYTHDIGVLIQERRNAIIIALELRLSCIIDMM